MNSGKKAPQIIAGLAAAGNYYGLSVNYDTQKTTSTKNDFLVN